MNNNHVKGLVCLKKSFVKCNKTFTAVALEYEPLGSRSILLQQTATHCTLHHIATHCNTLQRTATHCNTMQRNATHCNTLHHTASHCNTLQHTATHCNTLHNTADHFYYVCPRVNPWRVVVSFCNTLQCTATHCITLTHCNTIF